MNLLSLGVMIAAAAATETAVTGAPEVAGGGWISGNTLTTILSILCGAGGIVGGKMWGNRRPRSARTEQVDSYFGADRGFILRFLNLGAGLSSERVNYNVGNARRGHITPRNWFGGKSEQRITEAAEKICDQIEELITRKTE